MVFNHLRALRAIFLDARGLKSFLNPQKMLCVVSREQIIVINVTPIITRKETQTGGGL